MNAGNRDTPGKVRSEIFLARDPNLKFELATASTDAEQATILSDMEAAVLVREEALVVIVKGGAFCQLSTNSEQDPSVEGKLVPGSYLLLIRVNEGGLTGLLDVQQAPEFVVSPPNNVTFLAGTIELSAPAAPSPAEVDIVVADVHCPTAAIVGTEGLIRLTVRHLGPAVPEGAESEIPGPAPLLLTARIFLSEDRTFDPGLPASLSGDVLVGEGPIVVPFGKATPAGRDFVAGIPVFWDFEGENSAGGTAEIQEALPARLHLFAVLEDVPGAPDEGLGNEDNNVHEAGKPTILYDVDQVIIETTTGQLLPDVANGAQPILLSGTDFRPVGGGRLPVGGQLQFLFVVPTDVPARTQMVAFATSLEVDPILEFIAPDGASLEVSDDSLPGLPSLIYTSTDVNPDLAVYILRVTAVNEEVSGAVDVAVNLNARVIDDFDRVIPVVVGDPFCFVPAPPVSYAPGDPLGDPVTFTFESNNEAEFFFFLATRAQVVARIPPGSEGTRLLLDEDETTLVGFPETGPPFEVPVETSVDESGAVSFALRTAPEGPLVLPPAGFDGAAAYVLVVRSLVIPESNEEFTFELAAFFEDQQAADQAAEKAAKGKKVKP